MSEVEENVLFEIEGLKGEVLTSKIIYLLTKEDNLHQKTFCKIISEHTGHNISPTDFSIETEVSIEDKGRIDILIETESYKICIENKIWADFTDGQPSKYLDCLNKEAGGREVLIIVLAPSAREKYCKNKLEEQQIVGGYVITWETLLGELINKTDSLLLLWLKEYIDKKIQTITYFQSKMTEVIASKDFPSQCQKDFIYLAWYKFKEIDPWGRINVTNWYIGYPLMSELNNPSGPDNTYEDNHCWFGLVKKNMEKPAFCIVTTFELPDFELLKIWERDENWWNKRTYYYEIELGELISNEENWEVLVETLKKKYTELKSNA